MKNTLHRVWFEMLVAGLSALIFGVVILVFPAMSLSSLILAFAGYMITKGLSLSVGAWLTKRKESYWRFLFWYGILNTITGVIAARYPDITILILGFIVAVNLLLSGILQIVVAFHLRKEVPGDGWLIISGSITLVAGVYIYIMPRVSSTAILFMVAIASLVLSIFLISLSLAAKNWPKAINER